MAKVSIGMPVYNGDKYIGIAIDSVLKQNYSDFELIICDNNSTDDTQKICMKYLNLDSRIKYYRNSKNLGAGRNYNKVFELSNGEYFAWLAHDDFIAPEYIKKCVDVMDSDPNVVLCYAKTIFVNENCEHIKDYDNPMDLGSFDRTLRFQYLVSADHIVVEVFGLIRKKILKNTKLIDSFMTSDRVLLGELALYGRFFKINEYLFFHREHGGRSVKLNPDPIAREKWFDTRNNMKVVFPQWRRLLEHFKSTLRVPMSLRQRLTLSYVVLKVAYWRWGTMLKELRSVFCFK
jgi:glycosyltransferase involved in cell wall biosynthesis